MAAAEHHGQADEELAESLINADGDKLSTAETSEAAATENCFEPETVIADTLLADAGSLDNTLAHKLATADDTAQTETVLADNQGKGAGKRSAHNEEEAAATAIAATLPTAKTAGSAATQNVPQAETVITGKLLAENDAADDAVADKMAAAEHHDQTNTIPAESSLSENLATAGNLGHTEDTSGTAGYLGHSRIRLSADIHAMGDGVQSSSEVSVTAGYLGHTKDTAAETQAALEHDAGEAALNEAALDAREAGAAEFVKELLAGPIVYGPERFAVMGTPIAEEFDFYPGQVEERVSVDKAYKEILDKLLELAEQGARDLAKEDKYEEYIASVQSLQTAHNVLAECYKKQRSMAADRMDSLPLLQRTFPDVMQAQVAEDIRIATKNMEACRAAFCAATADHTDASSVHMIALRNHMRLLSGAAEQDMLAELAQAHAERNAIDDKLASATTDAANAQHDDDAEKKAKEITSVLEHITQAEKRNADGEVKPREDRASRIVARRGDLDSELAQLITRAEKRISPAFSPAFSPA